MVGGGGSVEQLQRVREEDLQKQEQQRLEDRVSLSPILQLQPHPLAQLVYLLHPIHLLYFNLLVTTVSLTQLMQCFIND